MVITIIIWTQMAASWKKIIIKNTAFKSIHMNNVKFESSHLSQAIIWAEVAFEAIIFSKEYPEYPEWYRTMNIEHTQFTRDKMEHTHTHTEENPSPVSLRHFEPRT